MVASVCTGSLSRCCHSSSRTFGGESLIVIRDACFRQSSFECQAPSQACKVVIQVSKNQTEMWMTHTSSLTGQCWGSLKDMPSSAKLAECAWDIADLLKDAELMFVAVGFLMGPTSFKEIKK